MAVDLSYAVQTQYPTVEFLGGTQTRDVVAVGITTGGHGVYVEFRIPQTIYSAAQVKDYATGYTGTVEAFFEISGMAGVGWSEQPTPAGELQDVLTFTVQSDSGNSAAQFTLPFGNATSTAVAAQAKKLVGQLNDAEALTG